MDEKQDEKGQDDGTKPEGHMQQTCLKAVFVILGIIGVVSSTDI